MRLPCPPSPLSPQATPRAWLVPGQPSTVALWLLALALALLLAAGPARAASYTFPTAMPPGCSGSNGNYTCVGGGALGSTDTVTISGTKPATITVSGDINVNGAKINQAGAASDLTIVVNGIFNPGYQGLVNANVRAYSVTDPSGAASIRGTLQATSGSIALGYMTTVGGLITGATTVRLGDNATAGGGITASGSVTTGYRSVVRGAISAGGAVTIGQETTVSGAISSTGSNTDISIGYAASVAGAISATSGQVSLAQNAVAQACVQTQNSSKAIILGTGASAAGVCCGALGSCGTSCVQNNSGSSMPSRCSSPSATLIARYDFDETSYAGTAGEWKDTAGYSGGPYNGRGQGASMPTTASTTPARSGSPGTCSYASLAGPGSNGPSLVATGLPTVTTAGTATTAAFWMRWSGTEDALVLSFGEYSLWFNGGSFGFNTNASDIYGISSSGLSGTWKHVVAVFINGNTAGSQLYIDGVLQTLTQRMGTPNNAKALTTGTLTVSGYTASTTHRYVGLVDSVRIYNGGPRSSQVSSLYAETPSTCAPPLHHLEIQHGSGTGLTCTPSTVTIRACQDAACTTLYTGGVTGTLSATGGSVTWPDGAGFTIAAGSSSTTTRVQATTTTATVLGTTGSTPAASSATSCNFGSPGCTFSAADSGFLFDVPNHVSEAAQRVNVSAVRKSDNSTSCTPAFASTSKTVTFTCSYGNPSSGTLPVRVGGTALNTSASGSAACDTTGRGVSLAFNASGVASTTVQYADAGQVLLSARYAGAPGGSEAGLVMTGSDSFIAAPDHFTIDSVTAGPIRAGGSFGATVTARNSAGATTPNHGRETLAQRAYIGWVKLQPTGSGAVAGSFSGTGARSFTNGAVSVSDLSWTEVGRGDLVVRGSDDRGYFGSGLQVFGSSLGGGGRICASENGSCVLPGGATATVYYGAPGGWAVKAGQSGTVACNNGNFGDPLVGTVKRCYYVVSTATNGSVGDFIPQRFSVAAPNACGAFTYAGQPATATVTAVNAAGNTTLNFNGTATTTPVFAQAVTLSDGNALGLGTLSGASIAASAFSAGVATSQVSYAFTSKTTAPQSLLLRAGNGGSGASLVSSAGGTEATLALRSGRLRLSNAYGKAAAALQVSAVTEYWGSNAWLLNSADSCTAVAGASVALSNPRTASGATSTASSSAGALAISGGGGSITLAAPSPAGSSLSLDLAVNLGSSGTDQSCHGAHPASTGAGKPWLRAQNGACAGTADRDPAARASFGIFSPETRRTVHVRELF